MINKLRKKFIRIALLSVISVMTLLVVILNVVNVISINEDLNKTLFLLSERPNLFKIQDDTPVPKLTDTENFETDDDDDEDDGLNENEVRNDKKWFFPGNSGPFNRETPFSTRFFSILYDKSGNLRSFDLKNIAAVEEDDIQDYLAVAISKGDGFGFYDNYKYYIYDTAEGLKSAIFLDAHHQIRSIKQVILVSALACAICIALVYFLVVFFSRRAIDPVVKSVERQKQFITDAGHELRTPITVINTSLSVLEMEVGKQKWIDKAKKQTDRMSELVSSLVTLSRMDEEKSSTLFNEFNVSEAVTEVEESFRETSEQRGYRLNTEIEEGLLYRGDEFMLRQLVSILLENALKYTKAGGEIKLTLSKTKKGIRITESNPCDDFDAAELPKFFDRFYRANKARTAGEGFGIGLSIARSIAEAHRGEITASSPEKGVILFTAVLN